MVTETQTVPQNGTSDSPGIVDVVRQPRVLTREVLAGVVTALALIPEVISFSFISGVDPKTALVASIVLCFVMSVLGGRPGMVTAAAGSIALVIGPMVREYGMEYILPTILLAGAIQIAFGFLGLARLMRFIPRSVMIGFVNALGILIFFAQVPHIIDVPGAVYPLFALTLLIVIVLPRLTTVVPSALVAIVVVTALAMIFGLNVPNVGGEGEMSPGLPGLTLLNVPLSMDTLAIVWGPALSVAFVGLLESLLTAKLVDEITDTRSHKGRESWALGVANIAAGFYGGIAGCAMIGQTVVNVKIGGARSRVSTLAAGAVLLILVTILSGVMAQIPMVALAAVMMVVSVQTVDWHSVRPSTLRTMPIPETLVMAVTVGLTVLTHNLAIGIAGGVVLAVLFFARRVAHVIEVRRTLSESGHHAFYEVDGPLFFGSSNDLFERFRYAEDPAEVTIDFARSQIWDASTVAALDSIQTRYAAHGTTCHFTGLDARSGAFHARLTGRLGD
ncbi:SulP family inorganic anion transporter [Falsirhodobacter algicola]|uniref:STAS domain-containing protein n=1 Tax=Falsirhodobacter algicola TaxID=2692330 RepID=A0A8J8SLB1_9RHOB|nr:SulP family inorganic anion transporter [Falsirhodobacter algicola]QUS36239.1 STAS domain-containing protein [Falsirhodobacter algicola]